MKTYSVKIIVYTIVWASLWAFPTTLFAGNRYESFFLPLDSAISRQEEFRSVLEVQIRALKSELDKVNNTGDRYLINKLLSAKYSSYVCDSALVYLDRNEQIALKENRRDWIHDICLERCYIYIQTGMLNAAEAEFDKIPFEEMIDSDKARYYAMKIYLIEQEARFTGNSNRRQVQEYGKELMRHTTVSDDSYIWALMWSYQGDDKNEKIIDHLKKEYEKNISANNKAAGNNALVISKTYGNLNNEEEQIRYLCLAALSDVKHVNRDPSSLLELIAYLVSAGDSERAYTYLDYVLQGQSYYPARASSFHMAQYLKRIFEETRIRSEEERNKTAVYLSYLSAAVILLFILFAITLVLIRKSHKQKKDILTINKQLEENLSVLTETREKLIESNEKMKTITDQVLEANEKLKESNHLKEEYIGYIFSACSGYLTKMDEFRQNINRKIKTGKVEDAYRLTQPTNSFLNNEVKVLNQTFDSTFLSIYPLFVEDFNSLLREEERITIHGNEDLNTELRIYALVWLGINSSSKIANLLHVSAQTVYNARMKMRNKAIIDGELFAEAVRSLGRKK